MTQLGSVFDSWNLTAELVEVSSAFSSDVELLGSVTVRHWDGVFTFDDLAVSHAGTYKILFQVRQEIELFFLTVISLLND